MLGISIYSVNVKDLFYELPRGYTVQGLHYPLPKVASLRHHCRSFQEFRLREFWGHLGVFGDSHDRSLRLLVLQFLQVAVFSLYLVVVRSHNFKHGNSS